MLIQLVEEFDPKIQNVFSVMVLLALPKISESQRSFGSAKLPKVGFITFKAMDFLIFFQELS